MGLSQMKTLDMNGSGLDPRSCIALEMNNPPFLAAQKDGSATVPSAAPPCSNDGGLARTVRSAMLITGAVWAALAILYEKGSQQHIWSLIYAPALIAIVMAVVFAACTHCQWWSESLLARTWGVLLPLLSSPAVWLVTQEELIHFVERGPGAHDARGLIFLAAGATTATMPRSPQWKVAVVASTVGSLGASGLLVSQLDASMAAPAFIWFVERFVPLVLGLGLMELCITSMGGSSTGATAKAGEPTLPPTLPPRGAALQSPPPSPGDPTLSEPSDGRWLSSSLVSSLDITPPSATPLSVTPPLATPSTETTPPSASPPPSDRPSQGPSLAAGSRCAAWIEGTALCVRLAGQDRLYRLDPTSGRLLGFASEPALPPYELMHMLPHVAMLVSSMGSVRLESSAPHSHGEPATARAAQVARKLLREGHTLCESDAALRGSRFTHVIERFLEHLPSGG